MKLERILIVRLSSIGDVIHTLPCLNALRSHFPEAYIAWIVEDFASDLLRDHPQLDEVFIIPKKKWRKLSPGTFYREFLPFIKQLRQRNFDISFDFQGLTKSSILAWLSGAKIRVGFAGKDGRELSQLFNNKHIHPSAAARHVVKRNFALLRVLEINNFVPEAVIPVDDAADKYIEEFLARENPMNKPMVAIQIAAGWETKQLPQATWVGVALRVEKELGCRSVFTWGPGEENQVKPIITALKELGCKPIMAPPTTLRQLVALLRRCRLMVGGDTGPVHLAGALGLPVVSIFGASDAARNAPFTPRLFVLQKTNLPCVPCWKTHCRLKNKQHLLCLRSITVDEIFNGIEALFEEADSYIYQCH